MRKNKNKHLLLVLYLIVFLILYNFPFREIFKQDFLPSVDKAKALEVTIDNNIHSWDQTSQRTPNVVFLSNGTTGYVFGVDPGDILGGPCVYWKTTDAGLTWSAAVAITSQTDCFGTTVWYDRWTPGDTTGNYIHIVFSESSGDDLYYERLDTTNDSQLGEVDTTTQSTTMDTYNVFSIAKATDNDLYLGTADGDDSFVVRCPSTSDCSQAGSWAETASNPMDLDNDEIILMPLASGNVLLINWDISAATNSMRSKVYTDSGSPAWDASWTVIGNATDNLAYRHAFGATVDSSNNIYFCYTNKLNSTQGDIQTFIYNGSWTAKTDVITNTRVYQCNIALDNLTGDVITTLIATDNHLYMKLSNDNMTTWSDQVQIDATAEAIVSNSLNMMGNVVYGVWKGTTNEDLFGNFVTPDNLIQSAYRFQDDNSAPNSNVNMANANTATSTVSLGQRITARIQVENSGLAATTTVYKLQFSINLSSWTDVGPWTAISYATGTSDTGAAITSQVAGAPTGLTWANGTWNEMATSTGTFTLTNGYYTEFAFMIHTANAAENTTYYLRLYNTTSNQTLRGYAYYPTLTTANSTNNTRRYSFNRFATPPTITNDLDYYFDDLEYTRVASSNDIYATSASTAVSAPFVLLIKKNSNSTDQISPSWEGQTSTACDATKYVVLEVYNFTVSGWQSKATSTTCLADTDFTLTTTISSGVSSFYDGSSWTYWRVYKTEYNTRVLTDSYSVTFSAGGGALSLSAPATVTFSSYTLGGSGMSEYTFATGTEQIIAADSGLGSGWTLSGTLTDWDYTPTKKIPNSQTYFQSNGTLSTEPTIVFSNQSTTGVSEGTDNQGFSGSVTLVTASNGNGVGTYYIQPTLDLYIYNTSTYIGTYTATMTLTLALNARPPLFKTLWQRLRDFSTLGRNAKFFNEEYGFNKLAYLNNYNWPKLFIVNSKEWQGERLIA